MKISNKDLEGETWSRVERTPFAGEVINAINKRHIIKREALKFKEANPDATSYECYLRGVHYVNRERKHYKAYLKGKNSYTYKGGTFLVEDEARKKVFEMLNEKFEELYKKEQLKKEEE